MTLSNVKLLDAAKEAIMPSDAAQLWTAVAATSAVDSVSMGAGERWVVKAEGDSDIWYALTALAEGAFEGAAGDLGNVGTRLYATCPRADFVCNVAKVAMNLVFKCSGTAAVFKYRKVDKT